MRVLVLLLIFSAIFIFPTKSFAVVDLKGVPNNKVGIGLLSPESEIQDAKELVNTNGDWGWVTLVIKKEERDRERWQNIFNQLNKNHLIPIVRIATKFDGDIWQKPEEDDAEVWAKFLDSLYWPTKNRYVVVYNEVNRATEWGGVVDPLEYSRELSKTIEKLKSKNEDFFVLPAPLDLALTDSKSSISADRYFFEMAKADKAIFEKIDGWASHSYPNPDFSSSPSKLGRDSINGYIWELGQIKKYTNKDLPVFITETGWRRYDSKEPTEETISQFYEIAFSNVWKNEKIICVTPFVLSYPDDLYFGFSFKKRADGSFFKYYDAIKNLPKTKGEPIQENKYNYLKINMPNIVIKNNPKTAIINLKNAGNKIWNADKDLKVEIDGDIDAIPVVDWSKNEVFPGEFIEGIVDISFADEGEKNIKIKISLENKLIADNTHIVRSVSFLIFLVENVKKNLTLLPALSSFVKY